METNLNVVSTRSNFEQCKVEYSVSVHTDECSYDVFL